MRYPAVDRRYIWHRDSGLCRHCGKAISYGKMSLDHYFPRSQNGPDSVFNLVCSCKRCNNMKRSSTPEDWESVWVQLFMRALQDRRIFSGIPGLRYDDLVESAQGICRTQQEGETVIFENNYKRFHVKHDRIVKISEITNRRHVFL